MLKIKFLQTVFAASALLVLLGSGCQQTVRCKFKPEAILSKDLPGVAAYNFEVQGIESLESVLFKSQLMLEIHQEVCNSTKQEYKFTVKGDYSAYPDSLWLRESVRQLTWLSTLSERQAPLRQWAGILEASRRGMKLAEEKEIQPGILVKVDRVLGPEQSVLLVNFAQK